MPKATQFLGGMVDDDSDKENEPNFTISAGNDSAILAGNDSIISPGIMMLPVQLYINVGIKQHQ